MEPTKEEIYDSKIEPLMAKILAICRERNIAMVASFGLDGDLLCTSYLLEDEFDPPHQFLKAASLLRRGSAHQAFVMTISTPQAQET